MNSTRCSRTTRSPAIFGDGSIDDILGEDLTAEEAEDGSGLVDQLREALKYVPGGTSGKLGRGADMVLRAVGSEAAAAIAPYAAAAIAIYIAGTKTLELFGAAVQGAAHKAEEFGVAIAKNDIGDVLMDSADGAADSLMSFSESIFSLGGIALATGLKNNLAMIEAGRKVVDALVQRGRELEGLNADLAYAGAEADVRKLEADIREAETVGPDVGSLIESTSRVETAIQDIFSPIKAGLADATDRVVEPLADMLEFQRDILVPLFERINGVSRFFDDVDLAGFIPVVKLIRMAMDTPFVKHWLGSLPSQAADEATFNRTLSEILGLQPRFPQGNQAAPPIPAPPFVPLLQP
jgi:hypothetical protein